MGTHTEILWECYGNSHRNPVGMLWELTQKSCGNRMGTHTEILWECYGNSHRNPVGIGWEWELKFTFHGNPEMNTTRTVPIRTCLVSY